MISKTIKILLILLFFGSALAFAQAKKLPSDKLYLSGITSLQKNNYEQAEDYFKKSVRKNSNALSYFELAKIYLKENTYRSRNKAVELLKKAVFIAPDNIEIRYSYAELLEDFARVSAFGQYEKILELDSTQLKAWYKLGKLKSEDFDEFNRSGRQLSEDFLASLQDYADEDFYQAEKYFKKALEIDSLDYNTNMELSLLYENAERYEEGIKYLERLNRIKTSDENVNLFLGLLSYKLNRNEDTYKYYRKAIALMPYEKRKEFTYTSVKKLLAPVAKDLFDELDDEQIKQVVEIYWKKNDPLHLTNYNERLLEHYSRLAYSNIHFSVSKLNIEGWKSDRGEVVVRYGIPETRIRIRPQMSGKGVLMKTEVWNYNGVSLGFTDMFSNGNFQFSIPAPDKAKLIPQFGGNTLDYVTNLKTLIHTVYNPKFEGPKFDVPYSITQFKDIEDSSDIYTELYVNYRMEYADSIFTSDEKKYSYKWGIFQFDELMNNLSQNSALVSELKDENIIKSNEKEYFISSSKLSAKPDTGLLSFELIREIDKGVFTIQKDFTVRKFDNKELNISDILLANNVTKSREKTTVLKRGDIYIAPNPTNSFKKNENIFIYYEAYNLSKDKNNLTDFEQRITISEKSDDNEVENVLNSVLTFIGFDSEGNKLTLSSNYQTPEENPQIYLQLDMSNYEPGEYEITVSIRDKITGKEVSSQTDILWE